MFELQRDSNYGGFLLEIFKRPDDFVPISKISNYTRSM